MKLWVKIVVAIGILGIATGVAAYRYLSGAAVVETSRVYVPAGSSFGAVKDSLQGGVVSMHRFETMATAMGYGGNIKGGSYLLQRGVSYRRLVGMLRSGAQSPVKVTFNNMRTLPQLAGRIAQQLEADSVAILAAMEDRTTMAEFGLTAATMAVIFIPNTYELYWNISAAAFVRRMKQEYDRFWSGSRNEKLAATGFTAEQAITLASIVYEETKKSDEMARVAGVYINRLRLGMPLQADPTLKFALGDFSIKRILDIDKKRESPYNTYKYAGLPPGPISMPSIAAIDGVLDFESHNFLFFCARPDYSGYHSFSRTLAEHNANARRYWDFLDREGIRR